VKVVLTKEAQRQARAERKWWREHRDAKRLFTAELRAAREVLAHAPKHEVYGSFDGQPVRRLLLAKTRCHVYYVIVEREQLVRIVAIWGSTRGSDPSEIDPR
jgi:plasmid stabilization system protein ParE